MVKDLNAWEMSRKNDFCKFSVRSFSEAKVQCIKDYIKPSLRESAKNLIIHVGTKDVSDQNKSPELIAESIANLAIDIKNQSLDVTISNIIVGKDKWDNEKEIK